jgi:hypothetical protein
MSLTLQQILNLASNMALAGLEPGAQIDLDDTDIAETLLPSVFQEVGVEAAKDEATRSLLRRSKTVEFTDGAATLTDDVLTQYKSAATLYNPDDLTVTYSLQLEWVDFISPNGDSRDGRFHIDGTTIRVIEPGEVYDPNGGITEERVYVGCCVPEIPESADDELDIPDELINDVLDKLAFALRGKATATEGAASG